MEADSIVSRLWPQAAAEVEVLEGGITNRNFKITVDGDAYVLRIGGKDTASSASTGAPSTRPRASRRSWGSAPRSCGFLSRRGIW